MELSNKVFLIAGASGAIGSAVAQKFHQEGARLAITYLTKRPDNGLPRVASNGQVLQVRLDITKWEQVDQFVGKVLDTFGSLNGIVNCTGVLGPIGPTATVPLAEWVRAVEINLIGSFYLTRAALPSLLAQSSGKIIYFSGGGAAYARPFHTAYSASKAALVRFTESLADELRDKRIDVNAIAPGPIRSRMWKQMRDAGAAGGERNLAELENMEKTGGVSAERAATLAVFLASERSNGLTGRLISAIYDNWNMLDQRIPEIMKSDAGTLRRVPLT